MKKSKSEYCPYPGFYDLRDFSLSKKDFMAFWRVQNFLHKWELARQDGKKVPDAVREISGRYQQCLLQYERPNYVETENKYYIHLLFYCNEWKEWSSMRTAFATTNPMTFRCMLKTLVKSGQMEYGACPDDLDTMDLQQIDSCLKYGHIMVLEDGVKECGKA